MTRLQHMCAAHKTICDSSLPDIVKVAALKEVSNQLHRAVVWCQSSPGLTDDVSEAMEIICEIDGDIYTLEEKHRKERAVAEGREKAK